jgi:hypothetical protein
LDTATVNIYLPVIRINFFVRGITFASQKTKMLCMKKIFLAIAIGFSVLAFHSCSNDKNDKDDNKNEISSGSVPEPVKTAFNAKYANAQDVKWEDAHENNKQTYKAKFMIGEKKMKAEFGTNGEFIKEGSD